MASLGVQIVDDLKRITKGPAFKRAMERARDVIIDDIREGSERGENPDGNPREPLSPEYRRRKADAGRRPIPDFKYTNRAMQNLRGDVNDKRIEFIFRDAEVSQYMQAHQRGEGFMPERRVFPETEDMSSQRQRQLEKRIEEIFEQYFKEAT